MGPRPDTSLRRGKYLGRHIEVERKGRVMKGRKMRAAGGLKVK